MFHYFRISAYYWAPYAIATEISIFFFLQKGTEKRARTASKVT